MPDVTATVETPVAGNQSATLVLDPFTMVYDELWNLFERHHGVTSLVGISNRIRFHSTRAELVDAAASVDASDIPPSADNADPLKAQVVASDLPELDIRPSGGSFAPWATSTSAHAIQQYTVMIRTGGLRISTDGLFPLKWQLFCALIGAKRDFGLDFVNHVEVEDISEVIDTDRGTIGWVGVFVISVRMSLDRLIMELSESGAI